MPLQLFTTAELMLCGTVANAGNGVNGFFEGSFIMTCLTEPVYELKH